MADILIGNTIKFTVTTKSYSGSLVDVDTINITIYDQNGNEVLSSTAMTHSDTGTYTYEWDSTGQSAGYYYYYVSGTDGTVKFKSKGTFNLKNG